MTVRQEFGKFLAVLGGMVIVIGGYYSWIGIPGFTFGHIWFPTLVLLTGLWLRRGSKAREDR